MRLTFTASHLCPRENLTAHVMMCEHHLGQRTFSTQTNRMACTLLMRLIAPFEAT